MLGLSDSLAFNQGVAAYHGWKAGASHLYHCPYTDERGLTLQRLHWFKGWHEALLAR